MSFNHEYEYVMNIDHCHHLQCRGWGTDLVPPHMSQIYNQQMTLAEQVMIMIIMIFIIIMAIIIILSIII